MEHKKGTSHRHVMLLSRSASVNQPASHGDQQECHTLQVHSRTVHGMCAMNPPSAMASQHTSQSTQGLLPRVAAAAQNATQKKAAALLPWPVDGAACSI